MFAKIMFTAALLVACGVTAAAPLAAQESGHSNRELGATERALRDTFGQHLLARFSQPLTDGERQRVERSGLQLIGATAAAEFVVRATSRLHPQRLMALGLVSVRTIDASDKLHPLLRAEFPHNYIDAGNGRATLQVVGYPDIPRQELRRVVELQRGRVVADGALELPILLIEIPWVRLRELAAEDAVMWIEPPLPALTETNDTNRAVSGADAVQNDFDLDGSGVSALIYDTGRAFAGHADFGGRVVGRDTTLVRNHSTHVAGTVGGSGAVSAGQYRGMAPGVVMESFGVNLIGNGAFFHTDTADIEKDFSAALELGIDVANASVGSNVSGNLLPCELLGDYGASSALLDSFVRGGLGRPFISVWAAGNERGSVNCGTSYGTIAPPSGAKNPIIVGAINADDGLTLASTSWGPTDDGRLKPDLCAPGCQTTGDAGVTSAAANGAYDVLCGTSMAAPTVTGIVALLLESFRIQYPAMANPLNSTIKAVMTHTALDTEEIGPDYKSGYGRVQAVDALDLLTSGQFLEQRLSQGESYSFEINVTAGTPQLKVTLAWDDAAALPFATNALVNDLDLVVTSPSSAVAFPWTLDPANPSASAVRTQQDHLNNIEQVVVDNPEVGLWQVQVVGTTVPAGPQDFSLCADGEMRAIAFMMSEPIPAIIDPAPLDRFLIVRGINQSIQDTPELRYRLNGGAFQSVALTALGGDIYQVTLPAPACGHMPEYYFAAVGSSSGSRSYPFSGLANPIRPIVQFFVPVLVDDFESDLGWTVGAPGDTATTGVWERVDPVGTPAAPADDITDPGTFCFVTGQGLVGGNAGDADIDGGVTTLMSPSFDLGDNDARISYWRWYSNSLTLDDPADDVLRFEITNNGGASWETMEVVGPTGAATSPGWNFVSFRVSDFLFPTSTMQVRIIAEDSGNPHLVEAAVDDFFVEQLGCSPCFLRSDVNEDSSINITDATALLLFLFAGGTPPTVVEAADADGSGSASIGDVLYILNYLFTQGAPPPAPFPVFGCL